MKRQIIYTLVILLAAFFTIAALPVDTDQPTSSPAVVCTPMPREFYRIVSTMQPAAIERGYPVEEQPTYDATSDYVEWTTKVPGDK